MTLRTDPSAHLLPATGSRFCILAPFAARTFGCCYVASRTACSLTHTSGNVLGIESACLPFFVSSYLSAGKCAGQDIQEQQNTDADAQATIQGRVVAAATEADDADTAALLHFAGENTCRPQHAASAALSLTTCNQPVAASTRCGNDSLRQATNPIGCCPGICKNSVLTRKTSSLLLDALHMSSCAAEL